MRNTIQTATPWMSETDIDKGAQWRSEIAATLEGARTGVIILTPENLQKQWLLFEAGALSKKRDRVYTYLFGLNGNKLASRWPNSREPRRPKRILSKWLGA